MLVLPFGDGDREPDLDLAFFRTPSELRRSFVSEDGAELYPVVSD